MDLIDTQDLTSFKVKALDGEIGKITDFHFDEELFFIRYFVVNTGGLLNRKEFLVSPMSIHKIDSEKKIVDLFISKDEVENSPKLNESQTISRKYEERYSNYFAFPYYWNDLSTPWIMGPYGIPWDKKFDKKSKKTKSAKKNYLRSFNEVESYSIKGINEEFGHLQGVLFNPLSFSIDFIIIDTINYFPSKLVLARPEWITNISWHEKNIEMPFFKELIKSAPSFEGQKITQSLISKIDDHYQDALDQVEGFNDFKVKRDHLKTFEAANAVADIPSGLFIVTTEDKETHEATGFLASWVQQASFKPLMISLCIKDNRPGIEQILNNEKFCINVVSKNKSDYLKYFKRGRTANPMKHVQYKKLNGRGAVLDKAKSAMICKAKKIYKPGDHYLVMAEVIAGIDVNHNKSPRTYTRKTAKRY